MFTNMDKITFDAKSKRRVDDNGFMHVDGCHLTKEQVAPYRGAEIPDYKRLGLDPNQVYFGYRSAEELEKAVPTFNGLPLLLHHHPESASAPQKQYRVGSVGTSAVWAKPYIDNSISITDKVAIDAVNNGTCREISAAYMYEPVFEKGVFDGIPYDFFMRNLRGNHIALVEQGRAGRDVVVADSNINLSKEEFFSVMKNLFNRFKGAFDNNPEDVAQGIAELHGDEDKSAKINGLLEEFAADLPPEKLAKLKDSLTDLAYEKATDEGLNTAEAFAFGEKKEEEKEESEDISKDNTAEMVAAGENYERDKLMREHMKEDKTADCWDEEIENLKAKGLDTENPQLKEAFMAGMAKAQPNIDDLIEAKVDEKIDEIKTAQDAALKKQARRLESKFNALDEVTPYIGKHNPMSFDSANDVYVHACRKLNLEASPASARDVFRVAVKQYKASEVKMAQDAAQAYAPTAFKGKFEGLNRIKG